MKQYLKITAILIIFCFSIQNTIGLSPSIPNSYASSVPSLNVPRLTANSPAALSELRSLVQNQSSESSFVNRESVAKHDTRVTNPEANHAEPLHRDTFHEIRNTQKKSELRTKEKDKTKETKGGTDLSRRTVIKYGLGLTVSGSLIAGTIYAVRKSFKQNKSLMDEIQLSRADLASVQNAIQKTIDWLIAKGYPNTDILKNYSELVKQAKLLPQEAANLGIHFQKTIDENGKIDLEINVKSFFDSVKLINQFPYAEDYFVENLASVIVREAYGVHYLSKSKNWMPKNVSELQGVMQEFQKIPLGERRWPQKSGIPNFAVKHLSDISRLAAENISSEFYESFSQFRFLHWAYNQDLYHPLFIENALKQKRNTALFNQRIKQARLFDSKGNPEVILEESLRYHAFLVISRQNKGGLTIAQEYLFLFYLIGADARHLIDLVDLANQIQFGARPYQVSSDYFKSITKELWPWVENHITKVLQLPLSRSELRLTGTLKSGNPVLVIGNLGGEWFESAFQDSNVSFQNHDITSDFSKININLFKIDLNQSNIFFYASQSAINAVQFLKFLFHPVHPLTKSTELAFKMLQNDAEFTLFRIFGAGLWNFGHRIFSSFLKFAREGTFFISNNQGFVNIKNSDNKIVKKAPNLNPVHAESSARAELRTVRTSTPADSKSELLQQRAARTLPQRAAMPKPSLSPLGSRAELRSEPIENGASREKSAFDRLLAEHWNGRSMSAKRFNQVVHDYFNWLMNHTLHGYVQEGLNTVDSESGALIFGPLEASIGINEEKAPYVFETDINDADKEWKEVSDIRMQLWGKYFYGKNGALWQAYDDLNQNDSSPNPFNLPPRNEISMEQVSAKQKQIVDDYLHQFSTRSIAMARLIQAFTDRQLQELDGMEEEKVRLALQHLLDIDLRKSRSELRESNKPFVFQLDQEQRKIVREEVEFFINRYAVDLSVQQKEELINRLTDSIGVAIEQPKAYLTFLSIFLSLLSGIFSIFSLKYFLERKNKTKSKQKLTRRDFLFGFAAIGLAAVGVTIWIKNKPTAVAMLPDTLATGFDYGIRINPNELKRMGSGWGLRLLIAHELTHKFGKKLRSGLKYIDNDALLAEGYAALRILQKSKGDLNILKQSFFEKYVKGNFNKGTSIGEVMMMYVDQLPAELDRSLREAGDKAYEYAEENAIGMTRQNFGVFDPNPLTDKGQGWMYPYAVINAFIAWKLSNGNADLAFDYMDMRGKGVSVREAVKLIRQKQSQSRSELRQNSETMQIVPKPRPSSSRRISKEEDLSQTDALPYLASLSNEERQYRESQLFAHQITVSDFIRLGRISTAALLDRADLLERAWLLSPESHSALLKTDDPRLFMVNWDEQKLLAAAGEGRFISYVSSQTQKIGNTTGGEAGLGIQVDPQESYRFLIREMELADHFRTNKVRDSSRSQLLRDFLMGQRAQPSGFMIPRRLHAYQDSIFQRLQKRRPPFITSFSYLRNGQLHEAKVPVKWALFQYPTGEPRVIWTRDSADDKRRPQMQVHLLPFRPAVGTLEFDALTGFQPKQGIIFPDQFEQVRKELFHLTFQRESGPPAVRILKEAVLKHVRKGKYANTVFFPLPKAKNMRRLYLPSQYFSNRDDLEITVFSFKQNVYWRVRRIARGKVSNKPEHQVVFYVDLETKQFLKDEEEFQRRIQQWIKTGEEPLPIEPKTITHSHNHNRHQTGIFLKPKNTRFFIPLRPKWAGVGTPEKPRRFFMVFRNVQEKQDGRTFTKRIDLYSTNPKTDRKGHLVDFVYSAYLTDRGLVGVQKFVPGPLEGTERYLIQLEAKRLGYWAETGNLKITKAGRDRKPLSPTKSSEQTWQQWTDERGLHQDRALKQLFKNAKLIIEPTMSQDEFEEFDRRQRKSRILKIQIRSSLNKAKKHTQSSELLHAVRWLGLAGRALHLIYELNLIGAVDAKQLEDWRDELIEYEKNFEGRYGLYLDQIPEGELIQNRILLGLDIRRAGEKPAFVSWKKYFRKMKRQIDRIAASFNAKNALTHIGIEEAVSTFQKNQSSNGRNQFEPARIYRGLAEQIARAQNGNGNMESLFIRAQKEVGYAIRDWTKQNGPIHWWIKDQMLEAVLSEQLPVRSKVHVSNHRSELRKRGVPFEYPTEGSVRRELKKREKKKWKSHARELTRGKHRDRALYNAAKRFGIQLPAAPLSLKYSTRASVHKAKRIRKKKGLNNHREALMYGEHRDRALAHAAAEFNIKLPSGNSRAELRASENGRKNKERRQGVKSEEPAKKFWLPSRRQIIIGAGTTALFAAWPILRWIRTPEFLPEIQAVVDRLEKIASEISNLDDQKTALKFIEAFKKNPVLDDTLLSSLQRHSYARIKTSLDGSVTHVTINRDFALHFPPLIIKYVMIHEGTHLINAALAREADEGMKYLIDFVKQLHGKSDMEPLITSPEAFKKVVRSVDMHLEDEWLAYRREYRALVRDLNQMGNAQRFTQKLFEGLGNDLQSQRRNAVVLQYFQSVIAQLDANKEPDELTIKANVLRSILEADWVARGLPESQGFYGMFLVFVYQKVRGTADQFIIAPNPGNSRMSLRVTDYRRLVQWIKEQRSELRQYGPASALDELVKQLSGIPDQYADFLETPHYHSLFHREGGQNAKLQDHLQAILSALNQIDRNTTAPKDAINLIKDWNAKDRAILEAFIVLHDIGKKTKMQFKENGDHSFPGHELESFRVLSDNHIHFGEMDVSSNALLKLIIKHHIFAFSIHRAQQLEKLRQEFEQAGIRGEDQFNQAIELMIATTTLDLLGSYATDDGQHVSLDPVVNFLRTFSNYKKIVQLKKDIGYDSLELSQKSNLDSKILGALGKEQGEITDQMIAEARAQIKKLMEAKPETRSELRQNNERFFHISSQDMPREMVARGNAAYILTSFTGDILAVDLDRKALMSEKWSNGRLNLSDEVKKIDPEARINSLAVSEDGQTLYAAYYRKTDVHPVDDRARKGQAYIHAFRMSDGKPDHAKFEKGVLDLKQVFPDEIVSTPLITFTQGVLFFTGLGSSKVYALDPVSGHLRTDKLKEGVYERNAKLFQYVRYLRSNQDHLILDSHAPLSGIGVVDIKTGELVYQAGNLLGEVTINQKPYQLFTQDWPNSIFGNTAYLHVAPHRLNREDPEVGSAIVALDRRSNQIDQTQFENGLLHFPKDYLPLALSVEGSTMHVAGYVTSRRDIFMSSIDLQENQGAAKSAPAHNEVPGSDINRKARAELRGEEDVMISSGTAPLILHGLREIDSLKKDYWKGKRVLEIGTARDGSILEWLRQKGADVIVADIDENAVQFAKERFGASAVQADILDLSQFADQQFDLIIASSVLYWALITNHAETKQHYRNLDDEAVWDYVREEGMPILQLKPGIEIWSTERASRAARSIRRILKPKGIFATTFYNQLEGAWDSPTGRIRADHRMPETIFQKFIDGGLQVMKTIKNEQGQALFFGIASLKSELRKDNQRPKTLDSSLVMRDSWLGTATRTASSTDVNLTSTTASLASTRSIRTANPLTPSAMAEMSFRKDSTSAPTSLAVNSRSTILNSPFQFVREEDFLISNKRGPVNIENSDNKIVEKAPMANHSRPDDAKSELRAKSNADFIPNFDNPKWKTYTVKLNNPYSPRDPVLLQIVRAGRQNYQILVGFDEGYGYESTGSVGFYLDSNKLITSQFKPFDNFSANYYHKWSKQKIAKVIMAWIAQAAYQTNRTIESGFTGNLRLVNLREKFFADEVWVKNNQPDEYGQWEPLKAIGYHHFNHQIFGRIEVYVQENSRHKWRLIELDGDGLPDRVYRVINGWDLRFVYIDGKGNIYKFVQGRRGSKVGVLDDWQNYGALSHRGKPRPDRKLSRTKEPPTYNKKVFPRGGHQRRLKTETGVSREKRRRSSRSKLRFSDPKSAALAKLVIPPSSELRVINQENNISDVSFESLTWESVIAPEIKGRAANSANQFEEAYATLPHSSIQEAVSLTAGQSEAIETDDNQTIIVYGVAPGMLENLPIAYAGATVMRKSGPVVIFGGTQMQASFLKNHFFRDDNANHSVNIVTRTNATTVLKGITGNNIKFVLYGVEGKDEHFADQLRSELRNVQFESRLESPDQLTTRFGVDQIAESLRSELRAAWAQLTAA